VVFPPTLLLLIGCVLVVTSTVNQVVIIPAILSVYRMMVTLLRLEPMAMMAMFIIRDMLGFIPLIPSLGFNSEVTLTVIISMIISVILSVYRVMVTLLP